MVKYFLKLKKYWPILSVVALSLLLRLFKISSYMTFLGDEGRDALVWLRMMGGKFTLIGPQTSIGNMYLGPLYYYLMFPFYLLMGTTGPSIGVALFAGATTFLLWFCGKEWFSEKVGLVSAFLYAISPTAIALSRSSWNPNVMPFFSLLIIWGVWQFWQKDKYCWLVIDGVLLSFAVQSHYLGLLLFPVVFLFFLIKLISLLRKKDTRWKKLFNNFLLFNLCFLILTFLPLVWFDLRHNFINYHAFYKFFSERQTTVNFKAYKAIPEVWPLWKMLITRLIAGKNEFIGLWVALAITLGSVPVFFLQFKKRQGNKIIKNSFLLLLAWLFIGLIGMGLYKQHIYDHYFGFLFPAVFLYFSFILERLFHHRIYFKLSAVALFVSSVFLNLYETPLKNASNYQMKHVIEIDKKIREEAGGKPFNLGLIAKQNYDASYRYFLEKWGSKATEIDAQGVKETITDQLFVVCEEVDCNPTTHPQAEIANFGWSIIDKQWNFDWGTKLYKLKHYEKN
ncbi:hypothetical protein COT64_01915 [Candidatus Shapirobacteria bacterium CG09_land_8_20_14_0_10_39_12]|uniref:Glycosyltransferase RgtA/B/C/D-like domain-containing protein n=1 Tax=Candidatus Shapirobacteria bacterium CG09_land_8_20_14_0_10_39_12 TaxID=1974885 RepID=A0A2H0WPI7_9BACT|nr:MAG: hypothetical protein COT64_01915 [Candidatus Shapirobacteria bacterium CG09_land_8_20_14_0_10_39_12]